MKLWLMCLWVAAASSADVPSAAPLSDPRGNVSAVYALLERVLPGSSSHFYLSLEDGSCGSVLPPCFLVADGPGGVVNVSGTSASELTAGLGTYLRETCGMTFGWARGGGSRVFTPSPWPAVGAPPLARRRVVPYSFAGQVCTHSYSWVWHSWAMWEAYIDRAALSGVNLVYALTGQEEVQWRVFARLGVADKDIRGWFNSPPWLTWSRGQNSHGAGIGGPLPRSWMRAQWELQRSILARYNDLAIRYLLPAFQGVVPGALAAVLHDSRITLINGSVGPPTGWVDALDTSTWDTIADAWMEEILADFPPSPVHMWQMDGFFANGTTWGDATPASTRGDATHASHLLPPPPARANPPCTFSAPLADAYLEGCTTAHGSPCTVRATLADAQAACSADVRCGGVTLEGTASYQVRAGSTPIAHAGETSWVVTNDADCHTLPPDPTWLARGRTAFASLARHDRDAVWGWQGWALNVIGAPSALHKSQFRGFASAPPPGDFVVLDMSEFGSGEWREWGSQDVSFVWTSLHTFGGNDGLKGNASLVSRIPFDALPPVAETAVLGVGYTPEGIDQNPAYYEILQEAPFRTEPLPDVGAYFVARAHRRYGVQGGPSASVTAAWTALAGGAYNMNAGVGDATGVGQLRGSSSQFEEDRHTPTPLLCSTWRAWRSLEAAASDGSVSLVNNEPFRYDLVNTAREVLAQLSTPLSLNFSDATTDARGALSAPLVARTGDAYVALLLELDALVATDEAFLLGPWLVSARAWGANATDCGESALGPHASCADVFECAWVGGGSRRSHCCVPLSALPGGLASLPLLCPPKCLSLPSLLGNARTQLTTWYPATKGAAALMPRDGDYARKQWSGLVKDYYAQRVQLLQTQALANAATPGARWNATTWARTANELAVNWTTAKTAYPVLPVGDAVAVSAALAAKYAHVFTTCG